MNKFSAITSACLVFFVVTFAYFLWVLGPSSEKDSSPGPGSELAELGTSDHGQAPPEDPRTRPTPTAKATKRMVLDWKEFQKNSRRAGGPRTGQVRIFSIKEDTVLMDENNNMVINEVLLDEDKVIIHGDILAGNLADLKTKDGKIPFIKIPRPKIWEGGVVPYAIAPDLRAPQRVMDAIKYINKKTVVKMVERKDQKDFLLFTNGKNNCYSYLGRLGGSQPITLSDYCELPDILHEIVHALGFLHEQNREDRDEYIDIQWENIEEAYQIQFKKIPNILNLAHNTPFDLNSLMLYASHAFAKDPKLPSIILVNGDEYETSAKELSYWDIERINLVYSQHRK